MTEDELRQTRKANTLAIISMIIGIIGLLSFCFCALGPILGSVAVFISTCSLVIKCQGNKLAPIGLFIGLLAIILGITVMCISVFFKFDNWVELISDLFWMKYWMDLF